MPVIRALVALVALATLAQADKARDCYVATLKAPPPASRVKPRELGCFEKIRATEDHAYGFRACFVVVDRDHEKTCTGTFDIYDANIEPDQALFEKLICKDGNITFTVKQKWRTSFTDVGPFAVDFAFTGKIVRGTLRGDFTENGKSTRVLWRSAKRSGVLERVRLLEAVAQCSARP